VAHHHPIGMYWGVKSSVIPIRVEEETIDTDLTAGDIILD